jgi:drug/metabolite transporter (DMT)-like permease
MKRVLNVLKEYAWILAALFCTVLWGTASPTIKLGYAIFPVDTSESFNIILFAGIRFVGAGIITLLITKLLTGESPALSKNMIAPIVVLSVFQTFFQYIFLYLGLAAVQASVGAILTGTSVFFTVILVTMIFRTEPLTGRKLLATVLGLIGIIVLNIGKNFNFQFRLNAEGLVLMSSLINALANFFMSKYSKKHNPMTLTGYQFLLGGLSLVIISVLMGGSLGIPDIRGIGIMFFLMLVASLAYGIWSMLLQTKPTSHVVIFHSFTPVFGTFFSWILFDDDIWNWRILIALALISLGALLVNYVPKESKKTVEN